MQHHTVYAVNGVTVETLQNVIRVIWDHPIHAGYLYFYRLGWACYLPKLRAGLTIRGGGYTNVRRGPFSHTRSQDSLWKCTFSPKFDDLFLVTSKQRGKNLAVDRGPLTVGPPPMVQPAQWLIRPCQR